MSGHVLSAGRVVGLRDHRETSALLTLQHAPHVVSSHVVSAETAAAIAADGLLFADVELTLTRAAEPAPAVDERRRYLAELDRSTRLERALADAEQRERDLRAAISREIRRAMTEAHVSDSDAIRGVMSHVADRLRAVVDAQPPHGRATDGARVVVEAWEDWR